MPVLIQKRNTEFTIGYERFNLIETKIDPDIYIMTVISMRHRWSWKKGNPEFESEIMQFYGNSQEDAFRQSDEWFRIITNKSLYTVMEVSG